MTGDGDRYPAPHFLPFAAQRLERAAILWHNAEWFEQNGLDATERQKVLAELLAHFGVTTGNAPHPGTSVILYAQRYGGTGGASHGGGGRAASRGGFNAKGIGRTPLASDAVDDLHANGCLWLHEAVRDIVWSTIACRSFPAGGVAAVCLIDLGIEARNAHGELLRRAVLVRPDFRRPAEFERSRYFGSSGTPGSDQQLDALSVQRHVAALFELASQGSADFHPISLFRQLGRQYGWCAAHRLWPGQFSSANVTLGGAFADFGAFCALPDWRRARRFYGETFGNEAVQIGEFARSLLYFLRKYGPGDPATASELTDAFTFAYDAERLASFARAVGDVPAGVAHKAASVLEEIFRQQQAIVTNYESDDALTRPWLSDVLARRRAPRSRGECALIDLHDTLSATQRNRLAQFLAPRPTLFQRRFELDFQTAFNPSGNQYDLTPGSIQHFIDNRQKVSQQ